MRFSKRWVFASILGCGAVTALGQPVRAVPPANNLHAGGGSTTAINRRPTVSPYLSLSTGASGAAPVLNYYNIVRPLQVQRAENVQQQAEIQRLEQQLETATMPGVGKDPSRTTVRSTGSQAWFMTHEKYFGGFTTDRRKPQ